ncbi:MAG: endonuclease MutS2, partial [Myxococcota bacterium]
MKAHSSDYPARVGFRTAQKTLERLDWPRVLEQLAGFAQTPAGRRHFSEGLSRDAGNGPPIFEDALHPVRARLRETAEARALRNAALPAPLGGVGEIEETLARAAKGGVLRADDLRTLAATLAALDAVRRHVSRHGAQAPRLAEIAESIGDHGAVVAEIGACIDASGEILDAASPALAAARRESVRLASEIEERIAAYLRDPDTVARLSDAYFTVRNDRFVLPVRADARSRVRGIVHGASKTGTTLFVEPEALVDLNNQRKRAEIDIEQETGRVLLRLSRRVAAEASAVAPGLRAVAAIDRAFARGRYAEALDATPPEVADEGVVRLPQLRHPLL